MNKPDIPSLTIEARKMNVWLTQGLIRGFA